MTNILVTGGAGYIGSHTCKELNLKGFNPVCYDNLSTGHKEFVRWGDFEYGDILDKSALQAAIKKYKPAAVIHFAASAYVGESVEDPLKYYNNNLLGSLTLLDVMVENSCKNLIFSSSCASYGLPSSLPIDTNHIQAPINPYGRSKLATEQVIKDYTNAYSLNAIILRYFNAAGADIDGEIGERHEPETHLIPNAINACLSENTLQVYGNDYDTADGTCVRDYIHVNDLASAHVLSLQAILEKPKPAKSSVDYYNLGSETGFSVQEIIAAVEANIGKKITTDYISRRIGDPPILVADSAKAKQELAWNPKHSDLSSIIDSARNWAQKELLR